MLFQATNLESLKNQETGNFANIITTNYLWLGYFPLIIC